jgi:hypothetical protein
MFESRQQDHGQSDSSCHDRLANAAMANIMGELLQKTPIRKAISAQRSSKFPLLRLPVFLWRREKDMSSLAAIRAAKY